MRRIALVVLVVTFAVGGKKSIAAEPEIVLSDIYDQSIEPLSASQQYAYRQYWASTFNSLSGQLPS